MRKGIKNVVKITVGTISTLLVLLITLPLLASLLINLPVIQNAIVRNLMSTVSEKLGTTISIDRVHIKFINRVVVDGFYVEDLQGDTLLYVPKLTVPIVELGLMGEPLTLGKVKLEGAELWLRRDSTDRLNIKQLLDAISGDDEANSDSSFRMKIMGIEADSLTFGLLRYDKPFREGVDFSRFIIRNSKIRIDDFSIIEDTIRIDVRSLSFEERSGFYIDELSAHDLIIADGAVMLDNTRIKAPGADLDIPYVHLTGSDWQAFRSFTDSVSMNIGMRDSHFTSDFVGWFLPTIRNWGINLNGVSLHTTGPVAQLAGSIDMAQTLGTSFALDFTSRGVPDFDKLWLDADIRNLETNGSDIDKLMHNITGQALPESVAAAVGKLGQFGFTGKFTGGLDDFRANGVLDSDLGEVGLTASVSMPHGEGSVIDGNFSISQLDIGQLLAMKELGVLTGDFMVKGQIEKGGYVEGEIEGVVKTLEYGKYAYRDISLDGRLDSKMFDGAIHSRDRNMDFDFSGMVDFNGSLPHYNFALDLRHGNLAATNIYRADSIAVLSGQITAVASGDNLDNLNGRIDVRDPVFISSSDTVRTDLITVTGRNSEVSKLITLNSEFADAEFRSRISYRDMFAYLGDFLRDYVPLLYEDGTTAPLPAPERHIADAANYSVLKVKVKDTDRLLNTFMPGTQVAMDSEVSFMFNPFIRNFLLTAKSEYIEYKDMLAANIELNSDNKTDSLTLHLTSEDFYSGSLHIPNLAIHGGARGRQMNLSTRLANPQKNLSAMLGLRIDSGDRNGDRSIRFRFTPSYISLEDQTWYISARSVIYDDSRITVDRFRVYSEGNAIEELTVDGIISKSPSDTLHIKLNRFDLSPFGQLAEGSGYKVTGLATGYVDLMSLLEKSRMNAGIEFSEMSLNGTKAAPLRFTSFWDRNSEKIRFQMLNQENNVNVLRGAFAPSDGVIDAVVAIDSLDIGLLDPVWGSAIEKSKGKGNFNITLAGTFKKLKMDGRVEIPRFETTVKFTQASYILENGVIEVKNSRLKLSSAVVRDRFGNTADFALGVDMSNLRNIGVDINASVNNLLAMDTGSDNNEAFYGQVFATGSLGIKVNKMGTKIDISATTGRGTKFHLPLNAKSNISWADFVIFTEPGVDIDTTNVLARKKLIYERKLKGDSRSKSRKPVDLNMTVDLTPDTEFHMLIDPNLGKGISAHGRGVINMRINPATNLFSMVGDCTISEGRFEFSMMDVINKDFVITPGSTLVWTGEPDDAILNVEATYRVRASLQPLIGSSGTGISNRSVVPVDCIIRLTERLSQPQITFDVHLPSADTESQMLVDNAMNTQELKSTQFLSLLMVGSFTPGNSIAGQGGNSGAATSGAVGFDILANQLGNILSNEDYNIYFRYRPQDVYTGNQFDIGFSKGFIDNRLILEIEGNYVEDRAKTSVGRNASNLSGDVYLTWVIDRAGNLKLKAFSQTIDRWDENQGMQESGLGIYYKKDFNSFRDIFRRNKDSFTNFGSESPELTKRQQREARRQQKKKDGTKVGESVSGDRKDSIGNKQ